MGTAETYLLLNRIKVKDVSLIHIFQSRHFVKVPRGKVDYVERVDRNLRVFPMGSMHEHIIKIKIKTRIVFLVQ